MNDDLSEAQFESGRKRKLTEHHAGNILACSETYLEGRKLLVYVCTVVTAIFVITEED